MFFLKVFNDGSRKELINLQGTIPVTYKGNVYHIPISIWVMDTHPNNAPMCYVNPTPEMNIKVGIYVDHNGKIYLPYLHDWVPVSKQKNYHYFFLYKYKYFSLFYQHSSDLLGLIQVMIVTFGDHPPVYAKSSQPTTTPYPKQRKIVFIIIFLCFKISVF